MIQREFVFCPKGGISVFIYYYLSILIYEAIEHDRFILSSLRGRLAIVAAGSARI